MSKDWQAEVYSGASSSYDRLEQYFSNSKNWRHVDPAADKEADLASMRAGLSPLPDTPARRRARLLRRLVLVSSEICRAVVLFLLCFAASTLALRLGHLPVQCTSAVSPVSVPTTMLGLEMVAGVRS